MEKFESGKNPESKPFFEENELDAIHDEPFKEYISRVGESAVIEEDGEVNLTATITNLTSFFMPDSKMSDIEKTQRIVSKLTPLKRYSYYQSEAKGYLEKRHMVCDRENLLVASSYLYVHKMKNEGLERGKRFSVEECMADATLLWGEHPMADTIKKLTEVKIRERMSNFENMSFSVGTKLRSGVEKYIPQKPKISDELLKGLEEVNKEWIEHYLHLVRREIAKKPSNDLKTKVEWGVTGPSKEIGEALEFIRRVKVGREIKMPLSDVYIGEWFDALNILKQYIETHENRNPNIEKLLRVALMKSEEMEKEK